MKTLYLAALFSLATALTTIPALAQETDWRDVTPRMEGCWEGSGMGGIVSECWLVDASGRADGMYSLYRDGDYVFGEILAMDDFGEGLELRLKHVNADMTGWEEKDDFTRFKVESVTRDQIIFRGLSFAFVGDDEMNIDLTMRTKDGLKSVPFNFTRISIPARPTGSEAD